MLIQALLDAPMFITRWRWVAGVSLALPRFVGGKKVPPQLARMNAEDLIAAIFPDQLACAENLVGEREIPDHPLVGQTIADCLNDAMDIAGLERLLARLESGEVGVVTRDLTEPSPLALEVLAARPYAYLDDAPLEERRTQAVMSRRWLAPEEAADLGRLDPEAIARVRAEAWPDAANADELHDALVWLGFLSEEEAQAGPGWRDWLCALARERRVAQLHGPRATLWIAAERVAQFQALWPGRKSRARRSPLLLLRTRGTGRRRTRWSRSCAVVSRGWGRSPRARLRHRSGSSRTTLRQRSRRCRPKASPCAGASRRRPARTNGASAGCSPGFTAIPSSVCAPRSSRSPRATSCVSSCAGSGSGRMRACRGPMRVEVIVAQLEGFEAPAGAWETEILPARIAEYEPSWLDDQCLAGRIAWARLRPRNGRANGSERSPAPVRTTPITLLARRHAPLWTSLSPAPDAGRPSARAQTVVECIRAQGASFFDELVEGSGLLRSQVEEALAELVALGLVTSDSFGGLRALLVPSDRRPGGGRRRRRALFGMEDAGRWALAHRARPPQPGPQAGPEAVEHVARRLLLRYGVVFWRLLEREADWLPPWRDLLRVYRRLEARGEIRGGRFVAGFSGEQFALPDAVGALREVRRKPAADAWVSVSGADPLNLVGILTPGPRLAALTGNRLLYRDGLPVALLAGGEVQFLAPLDAGTEWQARKALLRGAVPAPLTGLA